MTVKSPVDDQLALLHRSASLFTEAMRDVVDAHLANDVSRERVAVEHLAELIGHTMTLSDLLGRRRTILQYRQMVKRNDPNAGIKGVMTFDAEEVLKDTPISRLSFMEAIESLQSRYPETARGYKEVQRLYQGGRAFALAKHSSLEATRRIQKHIAKLMQSGSTTIQGSRKLFTQAVKDGMEGWTKAYADVVYRTNLTNSYAAGTVDMARDPDIADVIVGMAYETVGDGLVRPNHAAADRFIASTHDPIWKMRGLIPPLGYNCRCALRMVDKWEADRKGLLTPSGVMGRQEPRDFERAGPDKDFIPGKLT
jgi:SPP1 gp7 family putative phage head morphogenesis protein